MSNVTRTNAAATRTQPQAQPQEGFFGKVGRVLRETFSTPEAPVQKVKTADSFSMGQPHSRASEFRLAAQNAGRGSDGSRGKGTANASQDAEMVAWLNSVSRTGNPMV